MCLFLHVLQPVRDLVWLFRGGPPPGPAILPRLVGFDDGMIAIDTLKPDVREVFASQEDQFDARPNC